MKNLQQRANNRRNDPDLRHVPNEKDIKKANDNFDDLERYCTVEESIKQSCKESIKQSCKEIKDYKQGKIKLKSLKESFEQWKQWAKEVENKK